MSATAPRELFVYYQLREADAAAAARLVHGFQARLRAAQPALITRLLQRPAATDGLVTWMEVYALDPARGDLGGVDAALQAQIEAEAAVLAPLLDGVRHNEVFVDATHA